MLYWKTVNSDVKKALIALMNAEIFNDFRLVGGTALSLYLGHRISIDIDLFTDAPYGSVDFEAIECFLRKNFLHVDGDFGGNPGVGKSYLIGEDSENLIKLDLYYSMDPFFQNAIEDEGVRMATIEEIIAMKIDVVQRGGRKKDFWDLHELLQKYSLAEMIELHRQRFEWTHDRQLIQNNLTNFSNADNDLDPICLKNKVWVFVKEDFEEAIIGI